MTKCAKCGAELIGSRKFCAACGAPAVDPATLKRDASVGGPAPYGPGSNVNPFASTASPTSRSLDAPYGPPPATSAEPPVAPGPGDAASQVSPLAFSNALSQRGAFQQVVGDKVAAEQQASSQSQSRIPGTQLIPSIPNATSGPMPSAASQAAPSGMRPDRTQLMDASKFPRPPSQAQLQAQPQPQPQPRPQPQPQAPAPSGPWGWQPPPSGSPHGFGFAPGTRVSVTWSNGQRYPATVHQTSGTQCLVVFPDGQQHWVEMQYVAPA